MQIDLNNPSEFTLPGVSLLIASGDDSTHSQIRVTATGIAYISKEVGNKNTDGLAFRLETFSAGNGYVGLKASNDPIWVNRIYEALKINWPQPSSTYIDSF